MASVFKRGGKSNRDGYWYASWFDHTGKRRSVCTKTTDKASAERIAAKHEADAALRRSGVIDPSLDLISQHSRRSVESHLVDYEAKLRSSKYSEGHVSEVLSKIRRIAKHAGFVNASDINADGVNRFCTYWIKDEGKSARSVQAHMAAIKCFVTWLTTHSKLSRNPLASVRSPNPKADRRRERRMLLPAEWHLLRLATLESKPFDGIEAKDRELLYATAIQTGLRSNELRSLTRGRMFLESTPPYIVCKAIATKNKNDARQYLLPELASELAAHVAKKTPKAPVFAMPHETQVAKMLRHDLSEARRRWLEAATADPAERLRREESDFLQETNHEGERLDFHSLRHTCGAWLAMTGAHPKTVQTVMRHSTITLTMDTYGHLFPGQEAEAVARVQQFFGGVERPEDGQLRATGTDDQTTYPRLDAQQQAQQLGRDLVREGAIQSEQPSEKLGCLDRLNVLSVGDLDGTVRCDAVSCEGSGGRTRTGDTRLMKPLL